MPQHGLSLLLLIPQRMQGIAKISRLRTLGGETSMSQYRRLQLTQSTQGNCSEMLFCERKWFDFFHMIKIRFDRKMV
jgi:hypothetical protein